ncbi:MAG: diaminopimelate decarboxylase [Candidatus Lambdaproteobacteria bacterium RIFOXYD1_FULL_56_27]|uniref:Diaminopimelate decarboxylase n=1 Tax=Candidatus Lambdaproteobacteria bacterium RIFOXYD2_FULL_56_26 TaxID=1817773 RepID=A0A1F6GQB3_9PROT|nr:MAG: diaminopimelate decarboxylase [Candidatus Lambdaproteobacteria bacterium RIFOXYD2_FULL_56_26]OGH03671.1 MAG: diaminopimelate decarboxylase [Candidatus Lambdaproteobacteria bacterium RIFOXYC1_FULL_56_13]OGH07255.1 MAG: diaminopimelate decarboxylase [Candidatus Lambdaproteobacteria bacterium RIFOXYD1_FULL_56_27]
MKTLPRQRGTIQLGKLSPEELAGRFGTPLYLYDEQTLRNRCRSLKDALPGINLYYSAKANSNVSLLKVIKAEGLLVDAMSPGEVIQELEAGYQPKELLFVSNNVPQTTFDWLAAQGVERVIADSLSQMTRWCKAKPGAKVVLRLNPGKGAGHHEKVVTAGKVKFGIDPDLLPQAMEQAKALGGKVTGLMVHIGSLFLDPQPWLEAVDWLLAQAAPYRELEYLDFGGGLGIPYDRTTTEPFPLESFAKALLERLSAFETLTQRKTEFALEPGRFLVAESGFCLARVQSVKVNQGIKFLGTDLGFNFLIRPEMYGSYHEILHCSKEEPGATPVQVVGNVCESGDYLGKDRLLPETQEGDLLLVRDTGAYGFSMASNYNSMPRPAEVLIQTDGEPRLIRRAQKPEDILRDQVF